ncbi:MAG: DegV family protein [Clostridiales bacterium]|nr:DegV family protein [Clostridiales bacterium]MBD9196931.1 DegV family protein [Clostridiales bacterium]
MSVQIIVDSSVDVAERFRERLHIVPLIIHFGEEELIDGVTINKEQFYRRLVESEQLPFTSQASPVAFQKVYEEVTQAGDSAVVITLASKLSGTYQSACIAAGDFDNIYVVDSQTAAIGAGVLTEYALARAEAGIGARELASELEQKREDVCLVALLDTLEYLKRGGRISKTAALAGGLLNIKPMITVRDGEVVLIGKARGSKQGNSLLVEKIRACGGIDFDLPILLGYSGLSGESLETYVEYSHDLWERGTEILDKTCISGVIGTHTGPGVVAAAFFRKH